MRPIKALALDVDGVLTDDKFWMGQDGTLQKRFSIRDRTGILRALRGGLKIGLISGDSTPEGISILRNYAQYLGIEDLWVGCHDKARALIEFASRYGLLMEEIAFMGDDTIDVPGMNLVGLPAAPSDAHPDALAVAKTITRNPGGSGAVRELIDFLLKD